eukprot:m.68010 g.68010  ORF g.68010 m.68010 type:complete len:960 (-) comp13663_c0_seq1:373-3252(-)
MVSSAELRHMLAVALLVCSILFSSTSALQATIYPARDGTLIEPAANEVNAGGLSDSVYSGRLAEGRRMRAVFWFNIEREIPKGSTIQSVSLFLFLEKVKIPLPHNHTVHRLLKPFGEGTSAFNGGKGAPATTSDATWLHTMYPDTFWDTPGGDFVSAPSSVASVSFSQRQYEWLNLAADVQSWVDTPNQDYGFILLGDEDSCNEFGCSPTSHRFSSKDHQDQTRWPRLVVEYTPPATEYAACCLIDGGCRLASPTECDVEGGIYNAGIQSCSQVKCSAECTAEEILSNTCFVGACCVNGTCSVVTETRCLQVLKGKYNGDNTECDAQACALRLEPFVDPLPLPPIAEPYEGRAGGAASYIITIDEFKQKLHRDLPKTTVWGYNGIFPGPTIETWSGVPIKITWVNNLRSVETGQLRTKHYLAVDECIHGPSFSKSVPFTVPHVHGGKIQARWDGHPDLQFPPGSNDTYTFHNEQRATMLWYHDHALGITRLNVYMGLAGVYFIRDEEETKLALPSGKYEMPLVIMDRMINRDGSLYYPELWTGAFTGDFVLVNGVVTPFVRVERRAYRFRILNGCGTRMLRLKVLKGKMWVIGTEQGLRRSRASATEVPVMSGERVDVVIDFSQFKIATKIRMINTFPRSHAPGSPSVEENVLEFHVIESPQADEYKPPKSLDLSVRQLTSSPDIPKRTFTMREEAEAKCSGKVFRINGLGWQDLVEFPVAGTREEWMFVNLDTVHIHPMHMHLVYFTVLNRQAITVNGDQFQLVGEPTPPETLEKGHKDMVAVFPLQAVRVVIDFPRNAGGRFPYHCHILEHEDHDMMRQFHLQQPNCNHDGICNAGEDCYSCPSDCALTSGARCGNGVCEAGDEENCANCPEDCPGFPGGICCGSATAEFFNYKVDLAATGCAHAICTADGFFCREMPQVKSCCGDTLCTGHEDAFCHLDCAYDVALPVPWRWPGAV